MKKGSKKKLTDFYKGPDYKVDDDGEFEWVVPNSKEYYNINDLVIETKAILDKYGFKLNDLFTTFPKNSVEEEKSPPSLEESADLSTLYRYFPNRSKKIELIIPDKQLIKLPSYMNSLGKKHNAPLSYFSDVSYLSFKINCYFMETKIFPKKLEVIFKNQKIENQKKFLESIFLIRISEESWCYLLCYFALKYDKRQSVIRKLVESERLWPQYSRLLYEMLCYREEDIAFQHKVLSAEEQFRSNPKRLKKAFYELALEKLRPLPNKLEVLRRVEDIVKWNISLDADECFVLLIYEYLYQEPELSATARFLLSIMNNVDNIRADCQEYAKEVLNRFQQQVQEREDSALDSDFAYDE